MIWYLIRHDLRLRARELPKSWWLVPVFGVAIAVIAVVVLGFGQNRERFPVIGANTPLFLVITAVLAFAFTVMISTAIEGAVRGLFERNDLDLLSSSPAPSTAIFAARASSLATELFLGATLFLGLLPLVATYFGYWQFLGMFPALLAMSLIATAIGLLLTLVLVRSFGVRRTRIIAQVISSLVGAGVFLAFQLPNILNGGSSRNTATSFSQVFNQLSSINVNNPVFIPARATILEPIATLVFLVFAIGTLTVTVVLTQAWFVRGAQEALVVANKPIARGVQRPVRFNSGLWRVALQKEWRLILRDTTLLSRVLLQILYMVPSVFVFSRIGSNPTGAMGFQLGNLLAASAVLMVANLVMSLVRITLYAEDVPDLLASAPLQRGMMRRVKLAAALIPSFLFTSPMIIVSAINGSSGWVFATFAWLASAFSCAITMLWLARPIARAELFKPARGGEHWLSGLLQVLSMFAWLAVALGLESGAWWALVALGVGIITPLGVYLIARTRDSNLGYE